MARTCKECTFSFLPGVSCWIHKIRILTLKLVYYSITKAYRWSASYLISNTFVSISIVSMLAASTLVFLRKSFQYNQVAILAIAIVHASQIVYFNYYYYIKITWFKWQVDMRLRGWFLYKNVLFSKNKQTNKQKNKTKQTKNRLNILSQIISRRSNNPKLYIDCNIRTIYVHFGLNSKTTFPAEINLNSFHSIFVNWM